MPQHHPASSPGRRSSGFTLIEALIVLVVAGLLASIALPSYHDVVRKSRRVDATTALWTLHLAQERWRADHDAYATLLSAAPTASPPGLGLPATTALGHYTLAIDAADARGFTATATAVEHSSQAGDAGCQRLRLRVDGGTVVRAAAGRHGDFDEAAGRRCWGR